MTSLHAQPRLARAELVPVSATSALLRLTVVGLDDHETRLRVEADGPAVLHEPLATTPLDGGTAVVAFALDPDLAGRDDAVVSLRAGHATLPVAIPAPQDAGAVRTAAKLRAAQAAERAAREELSEVRDAFAESEARTAELERRLAEALEHAQATDAADKQRVASLEGQLAALEHAVADARDNADAAVRRAEALAADLEDTRATSDEHEVHEHEVEDELAAERRRRRMLEEQLEELRRTAATRHEAAAEAVEELRRKLQDAQVAAERRVAALERERDAAREELDQAERATAEVVERVLEVERSAAAQSAVDADVRAEFEAALDAARQAVADHAARTDQLEQERNVLAERLEQATASATAESREEAEGLRLQLQAVLEQETESRGRAEAAERERLALLVELDALIEDRDRLTEELAQARALAGTPSADPHDQGRLAVLERQLSEHRLARTQLRREVQLLTDREAEVDEQLTAAKAERDALADRLAEQSSAVEAERAEFTATIAAARHRVTYLESRLVEIRAQAEQEAERRLLSSAG